MSHVFRILLFPLAFVLGLACAVNTQLGVILAVVVLVPLIFLHFTELGLLTVLFCIPFDRLLIFGGALTVTKVFMLFTIVAWLINMLVRKKAAPMLALGERTTSVMIIAYLLMSLASLTVAHDLSEGVTLLVRRTIVAGFYFVVVGMVRNRKLFNRAVDVLLFASFFVCLIGLYEVATGDQVLSAAQRREDLGITHEGTQRIQACAGNADFHAGLLVILLPLVLARAIQARTLNRRMVWYGLVALFLLNIFATNTRLGILGTIVSFLGMFLLSDLRYKLCLLLSVGGGISCLYVLLTLSYPAQFSTSRLTGETGGASLAYRIGWIEMSWEMVRQHPILGVGLGNYFSEYNEYHRAAPYTQAQRIKNHNGVMQVWAEMGTVGLAVFLTLLGCVLWELRSSTIHQRVDKELRGLRNGLMVSFVVFVLMIGIIPFLEHEVGWLSIALAMALGNLTPRESVSEARQIRAPRASGIAFSV